MVLPASTLTDSHSLTLGVDSIVAHCAGDIKYRNKISDISASLSATLGTADDCDKGKDCGPSFARADVDFSADGGSYPDLPKPDYMATNATVTVTDAGLHFPYEVRDGRGGTLQEKGCGERRCNNVKSVGAIMSRATRATQTSLRAQF